MFEADREKYMSINLDFDYLSELYKTDPEKFEELRSQEIENVIKSAREKDQKRLRGLQFRIDATREIHAKSPMGACIAISKMMHESFEEMRFNLNQATGLNDPLNYQPVQNDVERYSQDSSAQVLEFRR